MKNNRNSRMKSAEETLQIIKDKQYYTQVGTVNIAREIDFSIANSRLYTSEALDDLLVKTEKQIAFENNRTNITVTNCTSMQAVELFTPKSKIGCLNFASAKNAGGGFMSGAQAQEECLARASSLYPAQMKFFDDMYVYNRNRETFLYSDRMIYSPAVCFFKDDDNNLLTEPYCMDILTSPAVNIGAMMQQNCTTELSIAQNVMMERIDKMLAVFYVNGVKNLILGAWGCGVFRNKPIDVASYFAHFLLNDGKYSKCFDKIVFAVYSTGEKRENIADFESIFG